MLQFKSFFLKFLNINLNTKIYNNICRPLIWYFQISDEKIDWISWNWAQKITDFRFGIFEVYNQHF